MTGEGIKSAIVGKPASFLIDYSGADRGSLAIETRGPSKLELDCDYRKFITRSNSGFKNRNNFFCVGDFSNLTSWN